MKLSTLDKRSILSTYSKGKIGCPTLARQYGVSTRTIQEVIWKSKVAPFGVGARRMSVDRNFWSVVDSERKSYWLGMLASDGHVDRRNYVGMSLMSADVGHIRTFRKHLQGTQKLARNGRCIGFCFKSKETAKDLERFGIVPNKSKTLTLRLSAIPKKLLRHFWRGMVDGNGGLSKDRKRNRWRLYLCGTRDVCEKFVDFALQNNVNSRAKPGPIGSIYQICFSGTAALDLMRVLYGSCSVALPRKLDLYKKAFREVKGSIDKGGECGKKS